MAKRPKRKPTGNTPQAIFRLPDETTADIDMLARHYEGEIGIKFTRTDVVKIALKKEADRIRAGKKK